MFSEIYICMEWHQQIKDKFTHKKKKTHYDFFEENSVYFFLPFRYLQTVEKSWEI